MENISTIGIDIGKGIFQIHGATKHGRAVIRKCVYRSDVKEFMREVPPATVGMEACSGAHYWAREFSAMGHTVKLMPPQYVKPYVKTNKNDAADAEACSEAVTRPTMRFVGIKTERQQAYAQLLCVRDRLVRQRTALANQVHGFLLEFGIPISKGVPKMVMRVTEALEKHRESIPELSHKLLRDALDELCSLNERIGGYEKMIEEVVRVNDICKRLVTVPGVGPTTALSMMAMVGDVTQFKSGRDFAAYLGLVPRQSSSASKERLGGISKRGSPFVRKLLVQGAHAVAMHASKSKHRRAEWFRGVRDRRGYCKAVVALANKNARIIWALLARGGEYQPNHVPQWKRRAAVTRSCTH